MVWVNHIEIDGDYPDFSKKAAMEKFMDLPKRVPEAQFELAIWLNPDDPEATRVQEAGWVRPRPEIIARTPIAITIISAALWQNLPR